MENIKQLLETPLKLLMTVRCSRILKEELNIITCEGLARFVLSEKDYQVTLIKQPNFGRKCLQEVAEVLEKEKIVESFLLTKGYKRAKRVLPNAKR